MVFGVFDGLHPGHNFFLDEAGKKGNLIIVVARDGIVQDLKKKKPRQTLQERISFLQMQYPQAAVVPGDEQSGSWEVLKKNRPDMIILGYDQKMLGEIIERERFPFVKKIIYLTDHHGDRYHSSLLRKQ